jgi:hypothetical protein
MNRINGFNNILFSYPSVLDDATNIKTKLKTKNSVQIA